MAAPTNQFKYFYWFCAFVFLLSFAGMMSLIFVPIPEASREMASNTQGFLQGSLIMSVIGYMLTGNISASQKKPSGPSSGNTISDGDQVTVTKE